MYILCIVLIIIASILLILAVLAQNPKSGMAANFGASNQVMGVRQTTDFLEKSTWTLAIAILVLSFCATMTMPSAGVKESDTLSGQLGQNNEEVVPNQVEAEEAVVVENEESQE